MNRTDDRDPRWRFRTQMEGLAWVGLFLCRCCWLSRCPRTPRERQSAPQEHLPIKRVSSDFFEGEVTVDGQEARLGQSVSVGATIITGAESICEVVFEGRNIFQVRENSVVQVSIDPSSPQISFQQGSLAAVFERLGYLNGGASFHLDANVATAGARGTVFFIKVEDADNSYICTCNGKLTIATSSEEQTVKHKHHKAYRYTRTGQSVATAPAEMAYHTDDEMEGLAAKIGAAVRWRD